MVREMDRNYFRISRFAIIFWCLIFFTKLTAQTHITLSQSTIYDNNILRNYQAQSDWINQTSLNMSHDILVKATRIRFLYAGDLILYKDLDERKFHAHKLGVESYCTLSDELLFKLAGGFDVRKNTQDYELYDHSTWSLNFDLKWSAWQTTPFFASYQYRNKTLENLAEFSFNEHQLFFQIKHYFPTKTTFIGEVNFGIKNYINEQSVEEYEITEKEYNGKGKGHGQGKGSGLTKLDTTIVAYNLQIPGTHQWTMNLKLAQSIFPTTGLSIAYFRYFKPAKDNRYLSGQEYLYTNEDELYDDHYSYSKHECEIVLTQLLPISVQLKIYFNYLLKEYDYQAYTNFETISDDLRKDDQVLIGLSINKDFSLNHVLKNMSIYLSYYYVQNESNDVYFDFAGHAISAGFELNF